MVLKSSVVRRPRTGERVTWTLVQPVLDLATQAEEHEFEVVGTIGNPAHLDGHGDHTPWSAGKLPGWIYALDVHPDAEFKEWLIAACRRSDYDTSWIDFFNIDGEQYNGAGRYLKSSGDEHLHMSVNKGFEHTHVTLFDDYQAWKEGKDMPTSKEVVAELLNTKLDSPAHKVKGRTVGDWLKQVEDVKKKVDELNEKLDRLIAASETKSQ